MAKQETLKATPPRGTRDFLPEEAALRDWACEKIKATYREHGFTPIETPALENIKLLKRGEGGENLQLIFEILKRGEKLEKAMSGNGQEPELSDLGLRFDLTVPLVRYYSNNANELPIPFKAVQIGNVWRAERPQKGRFRQFTQCDIDIIGLKSNFAELDLLNASSRALLALGLDGFTIRINDRRYLQDIARYCGFAEDSWERVFIAIDKLDKIGLEGVRTELLQENPGQEKAVEKLGEIFLSTDELRSDTTISGSEQIEKMRALLPDTASKELLDELSALIAAIDHNAEGYRIVFDPTLVRGMGYYTGPIFEISVPGYSFSVAGGGRYDRMIEKLLGREVPACGFSIGFERIITILQDRNFSAPDRPSLTALVYDPARDSLEAVMQAFKNLKEQGHKATLVPRRKDLKKQLDQLKEQNISKFCLFRGEPDNLEIKDLS